MLHITIQDINKNRLPNTTAPGPDRTTAETWNDIDPLIRAKQYNTC